MRFSISPNVSTLGGPILRGAQAISILIQQILFILSNKTLRDLSVSSGAGGEFLYFACPVKCALGAYFTGVVSSFRLPRRSLGARPP